MLVLNKINLLGTPSFSLTIRIDDSVETLMLNHVIAEDVTEDMITCNFSADGKELQTEEGLTIAEVISAREDNSDYYVASGKYEGNELLSTFEGIEFAYCEHMGTYLPADIQSVEMDYIPVSLTPVRMVDTLMYHPLKDEATGKLLASMFVPKRQAVTLLSDESGLNSGTINIAFENHMFYQYFGLITLPDGTNRYASFDVPIDERQTSALMLLQNDRADLEKISGLKINFIAESFTVRKEGEEFIIDSSVMLLYPFVTTTEVIRYKSIDEITANPFNLDEDSISTLINNAGTMGLGELKHLLVQNVIESI